MNILHIATYYYGTKVFKKQFTKLKEKFNIDQTVFIPNRKIKEAKKEEYDCMLYNGYTKLQSMMFYPRLNKCVKYLSDNCKLSKIELIHAHSVFADGAIALKIKEIYNIDYVVSVRADTIRYFRKMPHACIMLKKILFNAKKIIYINKTLKEIVYRRLDEKTIELLENKSQVIPNGIDTFYLENSKPKQGIEKSNINFLYVGRFINRKKIDKIIQITKYLNDNNLKSNLVLIGSGEKEKKCIKLVEKLKCESSVKFLGNIEDISRICKEYQKADFFIMPSCNETFGLVYIEAMSQGTPIIYKKRTGIDGFFDVKVGFGVDKFDFAIIKKEIVNIINNYETISANCQKAALNFDWDMVAEKVYKVYIEASKKKG